MSELNMRALMDYQKQRVPEMLKHWRLGNPRLAEAVHAEGLDFSLDYELKRQAIREAQREFVAESRGNVYHWKLDFGPAELEELRQRRASQKAVSSAGPMKPLGKLFPDKRDAEARKADAFDLGEAVG